MKTNRIVAEWLGFTSYKSDMGTIWYIIPNQKRNISEKELDFLHNRNQQKWIEDKLIELGYDLSYGYSSQNKSHGFAIIGDYDEPTGFNEIYEAESKESEDKALIEAVLQLIKEEK